MAISQNIGTMLTALLPAAFAAAAPPGSANVPMTVGALAFAVTRSLAGLRAKLTASISTTLANRVRRRSTGASTIGCAAKALLR
jgi:hypothetical protein